MRVITFNANGIRAAHRKGFFDWLGRQDADLVCIQETKAQHWQLLGRDFFPVGYHCYYHDARKKGYSGVALYSRQQPVRVVYGLGWEEFDREGRWLQADFSSLSVVSLYLPSGTSKEERQQFKYRCMERLQPHLEELARHDREYVICGDWNIAHREIDLKNWKANQKNSGFLPEERAWLDEVFGPVGLVDVFRTIDPDPDRYTWWSQRGRARENNVGWRIDYQVATAGLAGRARLAEIYTGENFSDHAPLVIDYDD
ncbi:MAG: exodeoxyribonuclease III [Pseudomonadota bacterium]|nr:MAG: exodeoxyribonuclease III [Pseudomonadota bacterium]